MPRQCKKEAWSKSDLQLLMGFLAGVLVALGVAAWLYFVLGLPAELSTVAGLLAGGGVLMVVLFVIVYVGDRRLLRKERSIVLKRWRILELELFGERGGIDGRASPRLFKPHSDHLLLTGVLDQTFLQFKVHIPSRAYEKYESIALIATGGDYHWQLSQFGTQALQGAEMAQANCLIGDDEFDGKVHLVGPPSRVLANLSDDSRTRLLRYLARLSADERPILTVSFQSEYPRVEMRTSRSLTLVNTCPRSEDYWVELVAFMIPFVKELQSPPERWPSELASRVTADSSPGVRRHGLQVLAQTSPGSPELTSALSHALHDPAPIVRVLAAKLTDGENGLGQLVSISESSKLPGEVRVEAFEYLANRLPKERLWPLLDRLIASSCLPLQCKVQELAAVSGSPALIARLCSLADSSKAADRCEFIVRQLARTRSSVVEPTLLRMLSHEWLSVRRAVVTALGEVGTIEAVGPLLELSAAKELGADARVSLGKIQARTHISASGRLSLSALETEGTVSIADNDGQLAVSGRRRKNRK